MSQARLTLFQRLQGWPRRLVILGAILTALVLCLLLIGSFLPEGVTVRRSVHIAAPRDHVWRALTNPAELPQRLPYVKNVTVSEATPTRLAWSEEWRNGAIVAWESTALVAPNYLVARFAVADASLNGTRRWDLSDEAGGTRLQVEDQLDAGHPLVRLVVRFFGAGRLTDEYVQDFPQTLSR